VVSTPLKNMKVSWDDYSQYMEKKKFQTTNHFYIYNIDILVGGFNITEKYTVKGDHHPRISQAR